MREYKKISKKENPKYKRQLIQLKCLKKELVSFKNPKKILNLLQAIILNLKTDISLISTIEFFYSTQINMAMETGKI